MLQHDLPNHRKAEADAEALGGEQRLEDSGERIRRNAWPSVDDGQLEVGARSLRAHCDRPFAWFGRLPGRVVEGLDGVVEQIDQNLTKAVAVERQLSAEPELTVERDARRHDMLVEGAGEPVVDIDRAALDVA